MKNKKEKNRTANNRLVIMLHDRDMDRLETLRHENFQSRTAWLRQKITEAWDASKFKG